jgi:hypothetical protein
MKTTAFAAALLALTAAAPALSETWTLNTEGSHLAFASVKNDYIGEVHTFSGLSGTVSDAGVTDIEIDLTTLETAIDIRNERMAEHVFNALPSARLSAEIDMAATQDLAVGDMMEMEVDAVLSFIGTELDLTADMVVVRLSEDRVMAMTNDMVFLETDIAGIDAGIDVLQELASLDHISRAVPVTMRLMFDIEN